MILKIVLSLLSAISVTGGIIAGVTAYNTNKDLKEAKAKVTLLSENAYDDTDLQTRLKSLEEKFLTLETEKEELETTITNLNKKINILETNQNNTNNSLTDLTKKTKSSIYLVECIYNVPFFTSGAMGSQITDNMLNKFKRNGC